MKLGVLFWFYKDVNICRNRLEILRRDNPNTPIYGLFGGATSQAAVFESELSTYLDDFFVFSSDESAEWRWFNGDLMIADWFRERGRFLSWDTVVVVQWDMLVFGRLTDIFADLGEGEILLSSTRPVEEVSPWWCWVNPPQSRYPEFVEHMREKFDYSGAPLCCQFVVVCFPRRFLELYSIARPEEGFIEYRVPTYAEMFGIPFRKPKRFDCWWSDDPATKNIDQGDIVLTAAPVKIPFFRVRNHLSRSDGSRIFHPFDRVFPIDVSSAAAFLNRVFKDEAASSWDLFKKRLYPTPLGRLAHKASRKMLGKRKRDDGRAV